MSFWWLPKLILAGVRFEQPYREMCIYVAKSCVFLSETKIKKLYFFHFVQALHIYSYKCKVYIVSHIKTHGQIKTACFFW